MTGSDDKPSIETSISPTGYLVAGSAERPIGHDSGVGLTGSIGACPGWREYQCSAFPIAAWAPSTRPWTNGFSLGIDRASKTEGKTIPYDRE